MSETIDFAVIILIVFYLILFLVLLQLISCVDAELKYEIERKVCALDEMSFFVSYNVYHPKEFFCKPLLSKKFRAHR